MTWLGNREQDFWRRGSLRSTRGLRSVLLTRAVTLALVAVFLIAVGFFVLTALHREDRLLPGMTLPRVRDEYRMVEGYSSSRAQIQIDRDGLLYFRGRRLPPGRIRQEVESDNAKRSVEFVGIQADRDTKMRHVYAVIEVLRGVGPHDIFSFAVHHTGRDFLGSFEVRAGMPPETNTLSIVADATGNAIYRGTTISIQRLGEVLDRTSRYDRNMVIAVKMDPDATVQQLVDILYLADRNNIYKVHLVANQPEHPLKTDATAVQDGGEWQLRNP